jgi:hypothetical protein
MNLLFGDSNAYIHILSPNVSKDTLCISRNPEINDATMDSRDLLKYTLMNNNFNKIIVVLNIDECKKVKCFLFDQNVFWIILNPFDKETTSFNDENIINVSSLFDYQTNDLLSEFGFKEIQDISLNF